MPSKEKKKGAEAGGITNGKEKRKKKGRLASENGDDVEDPPAKRTKKGRIAKEKNASGRDAGEKHKKKKGRPASAEGMDVEHDTVEAGPAGVNEEHLLREAAASRPKRVYKPAWVLEAFYRGGAVALSADGSLLACCCGEEVKLLDVATGAVTATLPGDGELVTALAMSPDAASVYASSRSLQTRWWDIAGATWRRSWKAHGEPVSVLAADSSGALLASGSLDRSVRVWDVEKGFCTHAFHGHKGSISCLRFHPDGHRLLLASASEDASVRVWDLVGRSCAAVLSAHFSAVTGLAFSPSGASLLSGARDKVVHVWSLRNYKLQATVATFEALEGLCVVAPEGPLHEQLAGAGPREAPRSRAAPADPVTFITVGERGSIRAWRSDSGECVLEQAVAEARAGGGGAPTWGFTDVQPLPGGQGILGVCSDQRLLLFRPGPGPGSGSGPPRLALHRQLVGYLDEVTDLRFLGPGGAHLAVATNSEQVRVYDVTTKACVRSLVGHGDVVLCLDATRGGADAPALLASGSKDNTMRVWDVESGECLGVAAGHMAAVSAVVLSKRAAPAFAVSGSSDRTIKLWSLEGVGPARAQPEQEVAPRASELRSKAVAAAHDKDINTLAISPNDQLLCSGSQDRTARVWRLPGLTPVWTLRGHKRGVWSAAFAPAEQLVLTASGDRSLRVWALADGACLRVLEGHTGSALRAAFLTRGAQAVSAGADGLLKLWALKTGECMATLDEHEDKVWALDVGEREEVLATGGADSRVLLWRDATAEEDAAAAKGKEEEIVRGQELSNAVSEADFARALRLAFELQRPSQLLSIIDDVLRLDAGEAVLVAFLKAMSLESLALLLEYIREWSTNARRSHAAQRVLQWLLRTWPPAHLLQVRGIQAMLDSALPYMQRHLTRTDRLLRSTFLLDYTLSSMAVFSPDGVEALDGPAGNGGPPAKSGVNANKTRAPRTPERKNGSKAGKGPVSRRLTEPILSGLKSPGSKEAPDSAQVLADHLRGDSVDVPGEAVIPLPRAVVGMPKAGKKKSREQR